jgi:hypothetical protein
MLLRMPCLLVSEDVDYSKEDISNTKTVTAAHREVRWKCFRPKKNCYCQLSTRLSTAESVGAAAR